MAEIRRLTILYEGDDDKAVLEKLQACGMIPPSSEIVIAKRNKDQHPGKEGLYGQLIPIVSPVGGLDGRAIVLMDLDEFSAQVLTSQFQEKLRSTIQATGNAHGISFRQGILKGRLRELILEKEDKRGSVVLVPVGYPEETVTATKYGIDRFAIDDWVFQLILHPTAFNAVSEFQSLGHDKALKKFEEVADLFRKNELEVRKAKTYIQILRAISDIRPSTSTIMGRIVEKGFQALGKDAFTLLLKPFLDDLSDAISILRETSS